MELRESYGVPVQTEDMMFMLAHRMFAAIDQPAYLVVGQDSEQRREEWLNPGHPAVLERYRVNARRKYDELFQIPQTPELFRKTPIVFPKGSEQISCGLEGGAQYGTMRVALSGLAGKCDLLIASILLAKSVGHRVWHDNAVTPTRLQGGIQAVTLRFVVHDPKGFLNLLEAVTGMKSETTVSGYPGIFVRTADDPRPAPIFGVVIMS